MSSCAKSLGRLSRKWLNKNNLYRLEAIQKLCRNSNYTKAMIEKMLDGLFSEITERNVQKLIKKKSKSPKKILHFFSSTSPEAAIQSVVLGILGGSENFLKLSSRDQGFLDIYLDSLKKENLELYSKNHLLAGSDSSVLKKLYSEVDAVIAYGSDESIAQIKKELPPRVLFVGCGHRFSFSVISKSVLKQEKMNSLIPRVAQDIWFMDQRGCLSSLILFVEKRGEVLPEKLSSHLAQYFKKSCFNKDLKVSAGRAANHEKLRQFSMLQRIKGKKVFLWQSEPRGVWSVFFMEKLSKELLSQAGEQRILISTFSKFEEILCFLKLYKQKLQGAALEAGKAEETKWEKNLKTLGVSRVCRAGYLQRPPLHWKHDGNEKLFPFLF